MSEVDAKPLTLKGVFENGANASLQRIIEVVVGDKHESDVHAMNQIMYALGIPDQAAR